MRLIQPAASELFVYDKSKYSLILIGTVFTYDQLENRRIDDVNNI